MRYILSFFFMIGLSHFVLSQPIEPVPIPNAKFPVEIWAKLVSFEISKDSPLRSNGTLNDPPRVFVVCTKNGKQVSECPELSGWEVNYPNNDNYEFLIADSATDEYAFEVWDRQKIKNKLIYKFGPFKGSEWQAKFKDNAGKIFDEDGIIKLKSEDNLLSISLAYAGTRIWYRLVNITIPVDSLHKTSGLLYDPPTLYIGMHVDGEMYGLYSSAKKGWAVDFPKSKQNCWAIREGTKRKYMIEVWDYQRHWLNAGLNFDHLVFTIADLPGISFREKLSEKVGNNSKVNRGTSILFEQIQNPQQ
jgi:hypothetical protein